MPDGTKLDLSSNSILDIYTGKIYNIKEALTKPLSAICFHWSTIPGCFVYDTYDFPGLDFHIGRVENIRFLP